MKFKEIPGWIIYTLIVGGICLLILTILIGNLLLGWIYGIYIYMMILVFVWQFIAKQQLKREARERLKSALKLGELEFREELKTHGIELPEIQPKWWEKTKPVDKHLAD